MSCGRKRIRASERAARSLALMALLISLLGSYKDCSLRQLRINRGLLKIKMAAKLEMVVLVL